MSSKEEYDEFTELLLEAMITPVGEEWTPLWHTYQDGEYAGLIWRDLA